MSQMTESTETVRPQTKDHVWLFVGLGLSCLMTIGVVAYAIASRTVPAGRPAHADVHEPVRPPDSPTARPQDPDLPVDAPQRLSIQVLALISAAQTDREKFQKLTHDFVLPDPDAWFAGTFGEHGPALAKDYAKLVGDEEIGLQQGFRDLMGTAAETVDAFAVTDAGSPNATGLQKRALTLARRPLVLYTVQLGKSTTVWSFAFAEGRFRYIGKLRPLAGDQ